MEARKNGIVLHSKPPDVAHSIVACQWRPARIIPIRVNSPHSTASTNGGSGQFLSAKLHCWNMLTLVMALACLATLAEHLGWLWWPLENMGGFTVQCGVLAMVGAAIYWFGGKRNSGIVAAVFALVNAASFVPLYFRGDRPAGPSQFRAMLLNVHTENREYDKVIRAIREAKPDVVLLMEINSTWAGKLAGPARRIPLPKARPAAR